MNSILFYFIFYFVVRAAKSNNDCAKLHGLLQTSISDFNNCVLRSYQPINRVHYCIDCSQQYVLMDQNFLNLLNGQYINGTDNIKCRTLYFGIDAVNIIEKIYLDAKSTWTNAACSNCFTNDQNETNGTIEFMNQLDNFDDCLKLATQNHKDVCTACISNYTYLNELFDATKSSTNDICFDIKDAMNKTQHSWSFNHNCCKDKSSNKITFLALSGTLCSTVIMFYLGFCIYRIRNRDIYETLNNSIPTNEPTTSS